MKYDKLKLIGTFYINKTKFYLYISDEHQYFINHLNKTRRAFPITLTYVKYRQMKTFLICSNNITFDIQELLKDMYAHNMIGDI